ncbi:hypothetical protein ABNF97_09915 [Plantactinospora sp. B6F1]|uniref:hypothetical protein n=1 Tax=Plantactinospora sp. B6F1 TaxID=3158971 RepID=UPI0032D9129A
MTGGGQPTVDTVERVFREEHGRLLASLVRRLAEVAAEAPGDRGPEAAGDLGG